MLLFVSKQKASECLNLSGSTLKKYRLNGEWIEVSLNQSIIDSPLASRRQLHQGSSRLGFGRNL